MNFRDRGFSDCSDQYEEIIDVPKANGGGKADTQPISCRASLDCASISFAWQT